MQVKTRKRFTDSTVSCQGKKAPLNSGCAKPPPDSGGTSRPRKKSCSDSGCDHSKFKSINALMRHYERVHRPSLEGQLSCFTNQGSLERAIELACSKKLSCGTIFPHLYRISNATLQQWENELQESVKGGNVCESFHRLWKKLTFIAQGINGIGVLTVYDTALKIGAFLDSCPDEVYLHAGTRQGAKAKGLPTNRESILVSEFTEPIKSLKPFEIEDFLCIFKEELKGFRNPTLIKSQS